MAVRHPLSSARMQFTPAPHITQNWHLEKPAASGQRGMVVSQSKSAAEAGVAVLDAGGNAIDAAVATALALAAVEPWNSGLGGIGHAVVHRAGQARAETVDFGPTAPAGLDPSRFKLTGRMAADLFAWPEVEGDTNIHGPLSFAIPSAVAGYAEMHGRWGKLPLAEIVAPAIALAKRGLPQDWYTTLKVAISAPILRQYPESARIYLRDGLPPVPPYQGALSYFRLGKLARHAGAAGAGRLARLLRGRDRGAHRGRRARRWAACCRRRICAAARRACCRRPKCRGARARCSSPARSPRRRPRPMCCGRWPSVPLRRGAGRRLVRGARARAEGRLCAAARLTRRCRAGGGRKLHHAHHRRATRKARWWR